jgi:galactokinase
VPGPAAARAWFARCYGHPADGVWFAPGRVNLLGGPDYAGGFVLPFALPAGVWVAAARRPGPEIAVASRQVGGGPLRLPAAGLEPGTVTGWAAYPAGVAWALREAGWLAGGAELAIDSDLPAGAGLASSAALECAVALALAGLYRARVPRRELAAVARRAENEFAGIPCGIMDQVAAVRCRRGRVLLLDCRDATATLLPLDPVAAGLALLVIDTRARHALGTGRYARRRRECEQAAARLGMRWLAEAASRPGAVSRLAPPRLAEVARHVVAEQQRVLAASALLRAGDLAGLGPLLTASHASLRGQLRVSWPRADAVVDAALAAGALGARMTGGGFGGSVVVLAPRGAREAVRAAVTERFSQRRWPVPGWLEVAPSGGARRVS